MEFVTCPICDIKIPLLKDSKIRFCDCKILAVDSAVEFTRIIGNVLNKEDKDYYEWEIKEAVVLDVLRKQYKLRKINKI